MQSNQDATILATLRELNARTPHRFTGVFKFDAETLVNLYLFDRENSTALPWSPFPATNSFCSIVRDTGEAFSVSNALQDPRVADHPARHKVISYCGVPLNHPDGTPFGSLCHFDYQPFVLADLDLAHLKAAAPQLMQLLLQ